MQWRAPVERNTATGNPSGKMLTGYALVAAGAALFSSKAIFIKLAYMEIDNASMMLALRMVFSLPFFVGVGIYAVRRHNPGDGVLPSPPLLLRAALTGFIGYYVASLLDFEGLSYITAQLERLVLFTYPIFVMLLGWALFDGRITLQGVGAGAITYLGLGVIFRGGVTTDPWSTTVGTALVLGAALTFALYQLLAKQFIGSMGSTLFTAVAMSAASVASILHFLLFSGASLTHLSFRYLSLVAGTALFATVLPSFLMNAGLARIGAQSTAMISTLSPLVTIYLAVLFLGERFTAIDAVGTALIIGGVGLYSWLEMRGTRAAEVG